MRMTAGQWAIDSIEGEMMPFSFQVRGGEEIRAAPCVRVPDLTACVMSYLDELHRYTIAIIIHYNLHNFIYKAFLYSICICQCQCAGINMAQQQHSSSEDLVEAGR